MLDIGVIDQRRHGAVLWDLDGVVTPTAALHARAWKEALDALLVADTAATGRPHAPFDAGAEYRLYVDGRPRREGVAAFCAARSLPCSPGDAGDAPGTGTQAAVSAAKDAAFLALLAAEGIAPYPDAVRLLARCQRAALPLALVSSSQNATRVLAGANLAETFSTVIDGRVSAARALAGKPAPDGFLAAADELGVAPARCLVLEDATVGVQAARAGGMDVIAIAREGTDVPLRAAGASVVVRSLDDVRLIGPGGQLMREPV